MGAEILNQDEIDALLKGVDDGAVATDAAARGPGRGPRTTISRPRFASSAAACRRWR